MRSEKWEVEGIDEMEDEKENGKKGPEEEREERAGRWKTEDRGKREDERGKGTTSASVSVNHEARASQSVFD